jgi:hypothetical protein
MRHEIAAVCATITLVSAVRAQSAPFVTVRGTVIDAASSLPLAAAQLTLTGLTPSILPAGGPSPILGGSRVAVTDSAGIIASFAPSDTVLVVRIERHQLRGVLELDATAGDRVSAQAIGGTAAEELLVLPGELRIANAPTSSGDYRIRVPASVRVVRVVLEGGEVVVVRNQENLRRRIELR